MVHVRLLAVWNDLVHDDRVTRPDKHPTIFLTHPIDFEGFIERTFIENQNTVVRDFWE